MQLSEIQQKIYDLTGTDSTSYPNSKMAVDMTIWQSYVVSGINLSQDESDFDDTYNHGDYPSGTFPLTTNRDYQIAQAEKVIAIKNVTISYDGVNYYKALPLDSNEYSYAVAVPASATAANTKIDTNFSKENPKYDVKYNSVFIYPKPSQADVDAGGKIYIEWSREAEDITSAEITTGTKIPGFDSTFHPILAYGPAYEYAVAKQLPALPKIESKLVELQTLLKAQYGDKQKDRNYQLKASDEIIQGYK